MQRHELKNRFESNGLVVLPVIHVIDTEQTSRNIEIAREGGCKGVFLINHDFPYEQLLPILKDVRKQFPDFWIGVNFLAVTGKVAFPVLAELQREGIRVDAYWADDARIDESQSAANQSEAIEIARIRKDCGWDGLYFGGTAFKKQREIDPVDYAKSAEIACEFMDVVTTSGVATGHAADLGKIETFRDACKEHSLGVASGITPENVSQYLGLLDCALVATGINIKDDFYNIDPARLAALMNRINEGG